MRWSAYLRELLLGYFAARQRLWRQRAGFEPHLLTLAASLFLLAAVLVAVNGLTTAFLPMQTLALALLPAPVWENITFIGDTATALALVLLFSYRFPQITLALLVSSLVATLLIHGFKALLHTPRPPSVLAASELITIGPVFKHNSMPSGHTATAFTLATLLLRTVSGRGWRLIILLAALLVGWSRIACGVHWPVDVLMGASIGLFSGWCGLCISHVLKLRISVYAMVSVIMLAAALYLFGYHGGFAHTASLATVLAMVAPGYWLCAWGSVLYWAVSDGSARQPLGLADDR